MQLPYKRAVVLSLMLTAGAVSTGMAGTSGRDVRGSYELLNPVIGGGQVSGTFVIWANNYGGTAVDGASFKLENISPGDVLQPGVVYLSSAQVSLAANGGTVIQGDVTIPQQEYTLWQQGAMPRVLMEYVDTSGAEQVQPVEISPKQDNDQLTNDEVDQLLNAAAP